VSVVDRDGLQHTGARAWEVMRLTSLQDGSAGGADPAGLLPLSQVCWITLCVCDPVSAGEH
jgi:hypothetical protein